MVHRASWGREASIVGEVSNVVMFGSPWLHALCALQQASGAKRDPLQMISFLLMNNERKMTPHTSLKLYVAFHIRDRSSWVRAQDEYKLSPNTALPIGLHDHDAVGLGKI